MPWPPLPITNVSSVKMYADIEMFPNLRTDAQPPTVTHGHTPTVRAHRHSHIHTHTHLKTFSTKTRFPHSGATSHRDSHTTLTHLSWGSSRYTKHTLTHIHSHSHTHTQTRTDTDTYRHNNPRQQTHKRTHLQTDPTLTHTADAPTH